MSEHLIQFEDKSVLQVFTEKNGLDPYIKEIKEEAEKHVFDPKNATSRQKTASFSRKIGSIINKLDNLGKDSNAERREIINVVNAERNRMKEILREVQSDVRKPLDKWEEIEVERIKIEQEKLEAEKLAEQVENDHEFGLLLNKQHDQEILEGMKKEMEAQKEHERLAEIAQKEHDDRIAKEAKAEAEKEKEEAEAKAAQFEKDKIAAQEKAERDAETARVNAEQAEIKRKSDIKKAKKLAAQQEINRQTAEKQAEDDRLAKLEANKRHVGKVRKEIKEHIMKASGIDEKTAVKVVKSLLNIDRITINY